MPTGGKTSQILVDEGLAAFLKEQKIATGIAIRLQIELNLTKKFIEKYNNWIDNSPEAKKQNYSKIVREDDDTWD